MSSENILPALDTGSDRTPQAAREEQERLDRLREQSDEPLRFSDEVEPPVSATAPVAVTKLPAPTEARLSKEAILAMALEHFTLEELMTRAVERTSVKEPVRILTPSLKVRLTAYLLGIADMQISFFVERHAFPELVPSSDYELEIREKTYKVTFIGGFFPSQGFGFASVSFLHHPQT